MALGLFSTFATRAGIELIKHAPKLMEEGRKIYESVRSRRRPQTSSAPVKSDLHSTVENLQERLEALEVYNESQAALIADMTRYQASLMRWLSGLALLSVATGAVALTAFLVAVLQ